MRAPELSTWKVLIPYDPAEGISLKEAAELSNKKVSTLRNWCVEHGLGRRVGDGIWVVSRVALAMYLDGDKQALAAYHAGNRSSDAVLRYFDRFLLRPKCCG